MKLGQRTKSTGPADRRARSASGSTDEPAATDRRILEHARRAFNERGASMVGMREIARDLGLSPGNVSYHFATKEALVAAMIREGHIQNAAALLTAGTIDSFEDVDLALRAVMRRDAENPWLMRDYVGLMVAMPALRELHEQLQAPREARVDAIVAALITARLLDAAKVEHRRRELHRQMFTQVFFWLSSAIASDLDRDPAECLDECARAAMALFLPYCTPAGRRQLEALLDRR